MPWVVQLCIVVVTIALVALCVATLRAVGRIEHTAERVSQAADAMTAAAHEAHEVIDVTGAAATRLRGVAVRFEKLGDRALLLSNMVLDEVEAPLTRAAAVVRGVRSGLGLIVSRMAGTHSSHHFQGGRHEGSNGP